MEPHHLIKFTDTQPCTNCEPVAPFSSFSPPIKHQIKDWLPLSTVQGFKGFQSAKLDWHAERTCSRLACFPHSVQLGLSAIPQIWRFDGQNIIDRTHQELYPVSFHGPNVLPRQSPFSYALPPCLAALFFHGNSLDMPCFLLAVLPVYHAAPILWVSFVPVHFGEATQSKPALSYCPNNVSMLQPLLRLSQCSAG